MTKEEKQKIVDRLHRSADAYRKAYSGNLYHEGMAQGLDNAAGIVGRIRCDGEDRADWRERKVARWIEDGYMNLPTVCSRCGGEGDRSWKYCPHCGSRIEGESDENRSN